MLIFESLALLPLQELKLSCLIAVLGMEKRGQKRALTTICVGVGRGVSLAMERV